MKISKKEYLKKKNAIEWYVTKHMKIINEKVDETLTVRTRDTTCLLGYITYSDEWHKPVFEPEWDVMFDSECLKELAEYLEFMTK